GLRKHAEQRRLRTPPGATPTALPGHGRASTRALAPDHVIYRTAILATERYHNRDTATPRPPPVSATEPPHGRRTDRRQRRRRATGNSGVHELAYVGDALWVVNTRFSCLCTLAPDASFVPRWRPPFVTGLSPEDRCHLNGFGVRDGRVRYATALGETDTAGGWRANKARGGVLMDVPSGEPIARGLSMPHSPRWYRDRL